MGQSGNHMAIAILLNRSCATARCKHF